ncbi:hypothetical protein [Psittacicella hinzii]|uniref:Uncharacterized protein n=1 Tax=Psittacicella hinzii TaxID=2028575 RepID=A0A3A1YBP4_9GAMM|nr:hypothetical protein [Psittacicella hinzii]RIY34608.1 hypothetical protein CKF58_08040 [Psittacicella hinzii]
MKNTTPESSEIRFINLAMYDSIVMRHSTLQLMHNEIVSFNQAFKRNNDNEKNYIEVTGCEVAIYFILEPKRMTFTSRSKVLRSYVFCLLVNYLFDKDFDFDRLVAKYHFENFLSSARIKSLLNTYELIAKLPIKDLRNYLEMNHYTFLRKKECECEHCGCRDQAIED